MKTKSLLLAFAGLGLFACTNEDLKNGGIDGEGDISVKISDVALSRAAVDYTTGREVTLNYIKLVLTAQQQDEFYKEFKLEDYGNDRQKLIEAVNESQFTGVRNPSKMEVFINTTKSENWTPQELMGAGLAEPLYDIALASTFVNKGDTDSDGIDEYEVTLKPKHTMSRLEFGGIAHVDTKENCMFKTIKIDGVMLDGVNGVGNTGKWDSDNLMSNAIGEDFTKATGSTEAGWTPSWPVSEEGKAQCYAYNIAPVTTGDLPVLKVCFSNITINTDVPEYSGVIWGNDEGLGYATVKNYKLSVESASYKEAFGAGDDNIIKKFPAGYIYQVKSLEIPDEAIGTGWNGGEDMHIYATITVTPWTIVSGSVEWN